METMNAQQAAEWGKTLDWSQVWAGFIRLENEHEKTEAAIQKLSDRIDEYIAEGERSRKRLDKRMGDFANTLGELIETLIAARLWEKFPEYKLARAYQRIMIYDENNKPKTDIDILLSNDIWAMVVEVKREANIGDIDHHLKRMELVRKYPPTDILGKKKLLGAIAGGVVPPDVKESAQKNGLFVLELNGDQVSRVESPEGFKAKEW